MEEGRLVQHLEGNISHFLPSANTLKGGSYQFPPWSDLLKKRKKKMGTDVPVSSGQICRS